MSIENLSRKLKLCVAQWKPQNLKDLEKTFKKEWPTVYKPSQELQDFFFTSVFVNKGFCTKLYCVKYLFYALKWKLL